MKTIPRLAQCALAAAVLFSTAAAEDLNGWTSDLDQALKDAKVQDKPLLVEFTGSDWCPPCIMMREKVFSRKEFVAAASKDFILVELDFPRGDEKLAKKNEPYAKEYKIEGFPTVILLTSEGKEFSRFFASQYPSIQEFLDHLAEALEKKDLI